MAATMPVAFQSGTLAVTSANSAGNETQNDKPAIPSTGGGIGAPLVKDRNVRLTAAPLTTGVAPGVSILPVGFTANTSATATVVQSADTAASPVAPTLKENAVARTAVAEAETLPPSENAPENASDNAASETNSAPATGGQTADAVSTPGVTAAPAAPAAVQENPATTPGDFIPPYTENLDAVSNEPLFSPPQTLAWIIALIALGLFVALFGWFVRRLVTNALEADEPSGESIFQTTSDQMYRFDDEDDMAPTAERRSREDGRDDLHRPLNAADYDHEMEEEDTLFGDAMTTGDRDEDDDGAMHADEEDEAPQKRGLMSWLFNRRKDTIEDDFDSDDEESAFIDVEVNPADSDEGDGAGEEPGEIAEVHIHHAIEAADDMQEEDGQADERPTQVPTPAPAPEPIAAPTVPQPKPARPPATTPLNATMFANNQQEDETGAAPDDSASTRSYLFIDTETAQSTPRPAPQPQVEPAPIPTPIQTPAPGAGARRDSETEQMLQRLEKRQQETGEAISDLRQKYTAQAQKLTTELGNFRAQTNSFQQSTNQTLEKRFAAISTTLEQGLAETRRLTDEKINHVSKQASEMSTEDLEKKLQHLDERFTSQARLTDMNFGKVIQKLDGAAAKSAPPSQDTALLRAMQSSLDESKSMLSSFQSDTKRTAQNVSDMGARLARLEAELSEQRRMVHTLIDEVAARPVEAPIEPSEPPTPEPASTPKMDALGLFAPAAADPASATVAPSAGSGDQQSPRFEPQPRAEPTPEPEPSPIERSVITVDLDEPKSFREARVPAGTAVATPAPINGHDTNAEASPSEDVDITPILVEPASVTRQQVSPPPQDGPLSFSTSEATGEQTAVQTPSAPAAPKPLRIPTETKPDSEGKTIRPLTFGFSSYDKNATNR
ncbi:MAG: hypothetical protein AAFW83_04075 [Pseudomonadota bacterium]